MGGQTLAGANFTLGILYSIGNGVTLFSPYNFSLED